MARVDAIDTVKDMDLRVAITAKVMDMENVIITARVMGLKAATMAKDTNRCMATVPATARDTTEALAEREYSA